MANARSPRITIHRAEEGDVAKLAAALAPDLSAEQVDHRWQEHRDGYRQMLIAELDGQVAGTVGITGHRFQLPDSLRLFALDVGPTFRGQGVGTTLIKAVEEQARHQGLKGVNLEVSVENADAIRLYERLGYRRLGEPVVDHEELLWIMVKTFGVQQTA